MKRVLIIIGKLYIGGAERVGRDIGYYADKSKYEIHYLVFEETIGEYEDELRQCGCIIHHTDPPAKSYVRYISFLRNLFKRERIDVIHSHTMFNSAWALIVGKYMGIPVRISHSHSIKGSEHRGIVKNIYENKDKFTLSDEQKKQLNEITAQIGHLQKNNEVLITHSLNVINKIFEGILNITSAKNADYNHLGKKNQDSGLDISSITEEA